MDSNSDASMLSDDLKPRRTPVPASFGDLMPRPSVPDLSIIETPQTIAAAQPQAPAVQPSPQLSHLSYNDWRMKTGGGPYNGPSVGINIPHNSDINQPSSILAPSSNVLNRDSYDLHKRRVDECVGGAPVQPTSYTNFKQRPTSAPVMRPHQTESHAVREHPLSKSTPPITSNQHLLPLSNGYNHLALNMDHQPSYHMPPVSQSSSNRQSYTHFQVSNTLGMVPGSQNIDPRGHVQRGSPRGASNQGGSENTSSIVPAASFGNTVDPRRQVQGGSPRSASNQHGSENTLSMMPTANFGSQNVGSRRPIQGASPRSAQSQVGTEVAVPSNDLMRNHVQFASTDFPPHHHPPMVRETVHAPYPPECYQSVRKNVSPCSCGGQFGCPPVTTQVPHANHVHAIPPYVMHHSPPSTQVSYDDLYKLVVAQNNQLKALQAQVERLLLSQDQKCVSESSCKSKELERHHVTAANSCHKKVVSEEGTQTSDCEQREDDNQKMSIGVMTSFIHAVTYRGRVGRLETVPNFSEPESMVSNGNHLKQSKSPSSDDCSSSSLSPASKSDSQKSCTNCCKDCASPDSHHDRSRKQTSKNDRLKQHSNGSSHRSKQSSNNNAICPEGCNCNNPGVSAAITAVRGCQAVLASKAGMTATAHDFSTFNGADMPTVTEQPVSPMSSIHVDLHDYCSSSSDDSSASHSNDEASSDETENCTPKHQEIGSKHNGWTFYNNMLGQVNKILEDREIGSPASNDKQIVPLPSLKQTDTSVSKRVAFEAQEANEPPQNLKELALRYLKENHPEELASGVDTKRSKKQCGEKLQEMAVYNVPASNMSFATFRYLERYNLLPENFNPQQYIEATANLHGFQGKHQDPHTSPMLNGGGRKTNRTPSGKSKIKPNLPQLDPTRGSHLPLQSTGSGRPKMRSNPHPVHHMSPRKSSQPNTPTSKILDITTLRRQPKLL